MASGFVIAYWTLRSLPVNGSKPVFSMQPVLRSVSVLSFCMTELSVQHLEKRKPADSGAWWCQGLSLVAGMCFSLFKHRSKTAPSSKSSECAGVGLQIPRHPRSSTCYLTGITEKLERCASVILKPTGKLKENICSACGLNEVWCYLRDQMPARF